jgi:hypothetical protein
VAVAFLDHVDPQAVEHPVGLAVGDLDVHELFGDRRMRLDLREPDGVDRQRDARGAALHPAGLEVEPATAGGESLDDLAGAPGA